MSKLARWLFIVLWLLILAATHISTQQVDCGPFPHHPLDKYFICCYHGGDCEIHIYEGPLEPERVEYYDLR